MQMGNFCIFFKIEPESYIASKKKLKTCPEFQLLIMLIPSVLSTLLLQQKH